MPKFIKRPTLRDLESLKVPSLRQHLLELGLSKTGIKSDLIQRLDKYYSIRETQWFLKSDTKKEYRHLTQNNVTLNSGKTELKELDKTFDKLKDEKEPNKIMANGIIKLLNELGLDPTSRIVLVIAWKFNAKLQCEFTREEFYKGMDKLGCDSISKLKKKLPELEREIDGCKRKFRELYQFTFDYAKEDPTQKGLENETALAYWNIVLNGKFHFLSIWNTFIKEKYKKSIPKDAWNMLLDFATNVKNDMSNYGNEEFHAMPLIVDEFVEYARPLIAGVADSARNPEEFENAKEL